MTNFEVRVCGGILGAAVMVPFAGGVGALAGYVCAKFADLPAGPAAKAWAVCLAAIYALTTLAQSFTEDLSTQALIKAAVLSVTSWIGMQELQNKGFMNNKMAIAWIVVHTLAVMAYLIDAALPAVAKATES